MPRDLRVGDDPPHQQRAESALGEFVPNQDREFRAREIGVRVNSHDAPDVAGLTVRHHHQRHLAVVVDLREACGQRMRQRFHRNEKAHANFFRGQPFERGT